MPLLVGIDEAGYGPLLGPLVVGATVWRIPAADPPDLWHELRTCVCRDSGRGQWRLVVADSKEVFDPKRGPASLERTVLAFAAVTGLPTDSAAALLAALTGRSRWDDCGVPWYRQLDRPLPCDRVLANAGTAGQRLRELHADRGAVGCVSLLAELVTEDFFNHRVRHTQNKAAVLIEQVLRLLARVAAVRGREDVHVVVDRLGGRTDYCALLRQSYPDHHVQIEEVSDRQSRYRLTGAGGDWRFAFAVEADRRHLPVALASMLAKYVRELVMEQLNAYWRGFVPTLRPTAGYYQDAQRFLRDIAPQVPTSGLAPELFVRAR